jgi:hypothetical protein
MADNSLPFALVRYPPSAEASALLDRRPEDLQAFYAEGVAKSFVRARYRASETLSIITDEDGHELVRFGATILNGSMCLDPRSGAVVQLVGPTRKRLFVNSSLRAFTAVIHAVAQAFPFYPDGATDEEIEAAAERTADVIRRVDEEALTEDGYWSIVISDMMIGDWGTKEVLRVVSADY